MQKRLQKVRAPRVQMTYDVEIGDAIENKELPFVVGVLGDFGNDPKPTRRGSRTASSSVSTPRTSTKSWAASRRRCSFRVENHLSDEGGQFGVQLQFREMADFRPESVVQQVAPLKGLLDARTKLADLRNKLAGNDKLDDILSEVLGNTEKLAGLRKTDKDK